MKFLKQCMVAGMLLNSFASFAGSVNPCNDGFCDAPSTACFKKTVTAKELFVKNFAKLCGDLTVKGIINNLELQVLNDSAVPPTDEVYNEFILVKSTQAVLENIQEFFIPRTINVPGTEIYEGPNYPNAAVYGYDAETQELIPGGGPELSYNPNFDGVPVRYHGQNPEALIFTTPDNMQSWYERATSYYLQRGLPLPGIDVYPQYEGQFALSGDRGTLAIKFHYDETSLVPTALDLIATNAPAIVAINLFEPDPELRENGRYYPARIPVTSDFVEFNSKYGKESIVYYDNLHRTITIHVPECSSLYQLTKFDLFIPESNCNVDILYTDNLKAFEGTFSLMRRNALNQLVSSSFADLEYLVQASSLVTMVNEFIENGTSEIFYQEFKYNQQGGNFTGAVIPLMNGGSPISDVYTYHEEEENANSLPTAPLILPALNEGEESFLQGDNPTTTVFESYGSSITNNFLDSFDWIRILRLLPEPVMQGLTYPEENEFIPLPGFAPANTILTSVVGHEMMHNAHTLSGVTKFVPTEGLANGVEMDPRLNDNVFSTFRAPTWGGDYLTSVIRADWPLTLPEINAPSTTYGCSIFWKYIATQFDYNYQVMRRMCDIITHESFGPLLEAYGVPFANSALLSGTLGYNPAGSLLALAQALIELHGKNIQDVFSDYAVSLAMLRNNTSIPSQYRHAYPYWLASTTYPGYEELAFGAELWATWWQDYQDNIILPADYSPFTDEPFVPVLFENVYYETQDMTMLIFEVPQDVSTVTVFVDEGEWRLSVVQFTSDGSPAGQFLMQPNDGPIHNNGGESVFDVSQFPRDPWSGSVRLVCANVGIHDYEGLNNWCGDAPTYTGKIFIEPN